MSQARNFEAALARLTRLVAERNLPGVTRADQGDTPVLSVDGTAFATLVEPDVLALSCPNDQKVLLMDISPGLYFETEPFVGRNTVLVRLDRIGDEELSLRLHDAWEYVAPDRLRKTVD